MDLTDPAITDNNYRHVLDMLREQKEQLEFAAELSGLGHWSLDLVDQSLFWSDQIHRIHGTDPSSFKPDVETAIGFYHEDDLPLIQQYVEMAIETGGGFEQVARLKRADGEIRDVHVIATTRQNADGETISVFGVFRDVTEEKRREAALHNTLEELRRSNEELNRFSYVCSHDMKEPVRMIESMANLLINPAFAGNEEQRNILLSRISTNTNRLASIIDGLLAYSRIDAKVEMKVVDLGKLATELKQDFVNVPDEKNICIEIGELPSLHGAEVHFTQLLQNLVGNALKFHEGSACHVKLTSRMQEAGVFVLVEDNGPGVPEDAREEIFNFFSRLKRRDEVEGTGLGLSIVRRIVAQYEGKIRCVSSSLGGAGFEIWFPEKVLADG
ncbi:MAG: PAS domain-containing protein [Rhizobiaceae bacterium]|nr:PAS domain-containing protein [Rhizobiaceae bacterium]